MPRLLFEKTDNAVWISHLDLMRLFQRAFKRAGLPLKHTQGFNPRPSVSIALPLSVGVESRCELLDFDLEGESVSCDEILTRLNAALVEGVRVRQVYEDGRKLKDLARLGVFVILEYDSGVAEDAEKTVFELFARDSLFVEKKSKNGVKEQDIIPMIHRLEISRPDENTLLLYCVGSCKDPSLNPMQLHSALCRYLPELTPDHVRCRRDELYDADNNIFR